MSVVVCCFGLGAKVSLCSRLLQTLHLGITPGMLQRTYKVLGIEPMLTKCKGSTILSVLALIIIIRIIITIMFTLSQWLNQNIDPTNSGSVILVYHTPSNPECFLPFCYVITASVKWCPFFLISISLIVSYVGVPFISLLNIIRFGWDMLIYLISPLFMKFSIL